MEPLKILKFPILDAQTVAQTTHGTGVCTCIWFKSMRSNAK